MKSSFLLWCLLCFLALLLRPALASSGDVIALSSDQLPALKAGTADFRSLGRSGNLLRIEANVGYNRDLANGTLNVQARQQVAALVIAELGDHYDFVVVAPSMQVDLGPFRGLHWQVHNDIQGIGRPMLDLRTQFGSAGRLKAVIDLDESILPHSFTSVEYDALLDTLMHEIMHQWGVYVPLLVNGAADSPLATAASHWSSRYDSSASVMFGARWQALDASNWRQVKVRDGFGPLDLYLAGFIPEAELVPTRYLQTNELQGSELPELGRTVHAQAHDIAVADLIAALGPRIPGHAQSQRAYSAVFVMLEPVGHPASAAELDRLELLRTQAQNRFAAITGGRAQLRVGLEAASLHPLPGAPASVGSGAGPAPALDLAAATGFLLAQIDQDLWQDKDSTRVSDSVRAMIALAGDIGQTGVLATASARLDALDPRTLEHRAALLKAPGLQAARRTELLQALLATQQADGGFGLEGGHRSAALDTALALQALAHVRSSFPDAVPSAAIANAASRLQSLRHVARNCWVTEAGPCELLSTVAAVAALSAAGVQSHAPSLFRWQWASGGFGGGNEATPFETALVLNALSSAGLAADIRVRNGHAWLSAQQRTDGSWGGSISATAEALAFFRRDARPDLLVHGALRVQPAPAVQGQVLDIRFDVRNAGSQPAPASAVVVDVRAQASADWEPLPGLAQVPAIAAGQQTTLQLTWDTAGRAPGSHQLRVRLDADEQVEELDESNNAAELAVALAAPPAAPDLAIVSARIELSPNVVSSLPQSLAVRFSIENLGLTAVADVAIRIHGFRFGELLPLRTVNRGVVAQGRLAVDEMVELTDPDITRIVVVVDPDDAIAEAREDNNRAERLIERSATVDLVAQATDIQLPADIRTGTPLDFGLTLRNLGTSDSPVARLHVDVRRADNSVLRLSDQDLQIPAASSVQRLIPWVPDLAGPSELRVRIDALDQIVESDETNNHAVLAFEVLQSTFPNLRSVAATWVVTPDPALEGQSAEIALTVINDSIHPAAAFSVEFAAARPGSSDYTTLGTARLADGLPAGASQRVAVQTPPLAGPYPRQLLARIDSAAEVQESNENDNLALHSVQVVSLPNLQLAAIDARLSPAQSAPGATVRLSAVLRNTGEQAVPSVPVELHRLGADGAIAGVLAPSQQVLNLQPGEARTLNFDFTRPTDAVRIELAADRAGTVQEGREDDNRVVLDLDNIDPDFYVTEPYFSPNGDGRADHTEIVARLSPPRAARVRVLTSWGEEVLSYGDGAVVAQLGGLWDGRRPDGRLALDDRYEVRLEDADGSLVKRLALVLDTNRRPLVLAARDGKAFVQSLDCRVSSNFDTHLGRHGLDFVVAIGSQGPDHAVYRYGFDGSTRLLMPRSAFPGALGLSAATLLDEHTAAVLANSSQGLQIATVDVDNGQVLRPPSSVGHSASAYLGRLLDGTLLFGSHLGIVSWSPASGSSALWTSDEPSSGAVFTFGTDRALMFREQGAAGGVMHVVGPAGAIEVPERIPYTGYEIWRAARFSYSQVDRAFYWSPGAQTIWRDPGLQKVLRIDEATGAVSVLASSDAPRANLAANASPSGRFLITTEGAAARARIRDLEAGTHVDIDLGSTVPTDVPPRHANMPLGQGIFEFHWSPDESHVAARFEAYQDNEPVSVEKFEGSNHFVLGARGLLIEAATGQLRDLGEFKPRGWVEGELQLLGEQDGIALERGEQPWSLLPTEVPIELDEHFPYRSSGLSAVFKTSGFGGCPVPPVRALFSRANGFARLDVEYVEALRTLVIRVSADDQNLAAYAVEFQPEAGGEWTGVLGGSEVVDDQVIGAWSPPTPGRYRLRLRAVDRAGNSAQTTQELVWFDAEPLGTVQGDLRHISPNGDGVQDRLTVRFDLRSAVALDIRVEATDGALVHNERLTLSQPGSHVWHWNGLQSNGTPLPDGAYRVDFGGRPLDVRIDNTPPTVDITENPPGSTGCGLTDIMARDERRATVQVQALDELFDHVRLESRPRDGSAMWVERSRYQQAFIPKLGINLRPQELPQEEYRMVAVDRAGNRRIEPFEVLGLSIHSALLEGAVTVDGPWHFVRNDPLAKLIYREGDAPTGLFIGLMARSLDGWQVEYLTSGGWNALPHTALTIDDIPQPDSTCFRGDESWIHVDLPTLPPITMFRLRRQFAGGEAHSNSFIVAEAGPRCPPGTPPELCPGPDESGPGSSERNRCDAVGAGTVQMHLKVPVLPSAPQMTAVSWFDSRNGTTVDLPLVPRPPGQFAAVDVSSLPVGEHVLRVQYSDGSVSSTTVGRDSSVLPPPTVERPLPNGRICIGDSASVAGIVDHPFLTYIEATFADRVWRGGVFPRPPGEDQAFPVLRRPDQLPGLSNLAPAEWRIGSSDSLGHLNQPLAEGPTILRVKSHFCLDRSSSIVEFPVVVDARVGLRPPRVGRGLDELQPPTTMTNGIANSALSFSPSLGQVAWIEAQSFEEVSARASLHAVGSRPVLTDLGWAGDWSEDGPALVELGSVGPLTGPLRWQWNGRDAQGQVLEGEYIVVVISHDDCGHERKDLVPLRVDETPPQVQWLEPASGHTLNLFQRLRARAEDQVLAHVHYSYSALVGGGQWLTIGARPVSDRGAHEYTQTWFSQVAPGTYRLRFSARDDVGLEGHADIEVQVPERSPLTLAAELNNELISPNGDGVLESTTLGLSLSRAALVSLRVIDASGAVRRTLADAQALNGFQSLTWDGKDGAGVVVQDGEYRMALRVVDPAQPAHFEEAELPVDVDNTPPQLRMLAPAGAYSNGRGALTLEVDEAHPLGVQVSATPALPGLLAQHEGGGTLELAQLDDVAEGEYSLQIEAQDRAGNRSQLSQAFTLDRTPPRVGIVVPVPDAVLTRAAGPIPVQALVEDPHLQSRGLELRNGDALVAVLANEPNASSGTWNTSWDGLAADGSYRLRLLAADRANNRAQVEVPVVLDNTPPEARIDAPAVGAAVGASLAVIGRASDANFDRFELDLAVPGSTPSFERIAEGSDAVVDGLLATVLSPASDGPYLLRLRVFDRAGHVSEAFREIAVDTVPPAAPTQLRAERQGPRDARLLWTASVPGTDVVRYRLLRNGQPIAEPAATQHLDSQLSEGVHRWRVLALDAAGNESAPSNEASLAIDTTPPDVAIYAPIGGSRRGGIIPVAGRAYSRDDFQRWELRVARVGQPATVLAGGSSAVLNAELVQWNSQGFDGSVRLQLEASDIHGNTALREIEFTVDNQPPAAPTGLVASESGSEDVRLVWTANTESDLHGYLVYRGARLLQGEPGSNPLLLAISDPTWLDEDVGDGNFQWRVQAVDSTGNLSAFSEPASLTRSGRPPRVHLVRPLDGERFETRTPVRGRSGDLDLAEVQFESRAAGAGDWSPFGPVFALPPFDSLFEPAQGAYGFYDLRARSLDQEGLSDPAPPIVRVEHRDLTPPDSPSGLAVLVDGGQATLTWEAVTATDLAHYEVQRTAPGGVFATVASVPAPATTYVDGSLTDGEYRYRIRAVDSSDNRSPPTAAVTARVFSLEARQPYSPTLDTATEWAVRSPVSGQLEANLQSDSGPQILPERAISASQWLAFPTLIAPGLNTLTVRARDSAGNRSRPADVRVLRSEAPPPPADLQASVNGHQVGLGWQMPAHPHAVSFRVFRDGTPIAADTLQSPQSVQHLPEQGPPVNLPTLFDGLPFTGLNLPLGAAGLSLQVQLAQPAVLTSLELQMDAPQSAVAATVEGEWMGAWVRLPGTLSEVQGRQILSLGQPYRSRLFRLRLSGTDESLYLRELKARVRPSQSANSFTETVTDGRYRYRVTALNEHAFESPHSEPADVEVGDTEAPPAVVLSGQTSGSNAQLQWTESLAPDLAAYRVLRGSTQIANITNLSQRSHVDAGLPNGAYGYRVLAVDQVGNVAPSNQIVLSIDIGTFPAPTGLTVEPLPGGGALRLRWQPGAGSQPAGYGVSRALAESGPFEGIDDVDGDTPTFDDRGLVNGTRYYYRVRAYDAVGNASPDSEIASGIPVFADGPVITPVFHYPTRYGRSVVIPQPASVIAGRGQPGSTVRIGTGLASREAIVASEPAVSSFLTGSEARVSPDARHVYSEGWLRTLAGQEPGQLLGSDCAPAQWLDAHRLLRCDIGPTSTRLQVYHLASESALELLDAPAISLFRLSADGRRLLVAADLPGGDTGLELAWREQQPVGAWQRVDGVSADDIDPASVRLHADARWAIWRHYDGRVQVLDMQTGQVRPLPVSAQGPPTLASRSPEALIVGDDGIHLANLASGAVAALDFGVAPVVSVEFNHDDTRVGLLSQDAWNLFRWPDRAPMSDYPINGPSALTALGTEEWAINADIDLHILQAPGVFRVDELELEFGDNVVAAIASAPGQLDSGPALPITITVPGDGLPDLALRSQDLSVLPNVGRPGSSVRVGARVRNLGDNPSPASSVSLRLSTPAGQLLPVQTSPLPALAAGAETVVGWQTPVLADSGVYGITVEANVQRDFDESSYANNRATRTLTVNADGQPELALSVDRAIVAPAEALHGVVAVAGGSASFHGRLSLRLLDDQGHLVLQLHEQVVDFQTPLATLSVPFEWTPGAVLAGNYEVRAQLHDAGGALLRTRSASVEVRAEALLWLSLDPSQQALPLGAQVQVQARLRYLQGNLTIENAELRSRLLNSGGLTVAESARVLGTLVVGHDASHPVTFATGTLAAGTYTVVSELWSGALLAESGAVVQLQQLGGTAAVTGNWELPDLPLPAGSAASLPFVVRNTGTLPLTDLPIRARVRRQSTGAELANAEFTWTLVAGESRTGSLSLPAAVTSIGALVLTLEVSSGSLTRMLDVRSALLTDVEPPHLVPVRPVNGAFVPGRFEVQVRVSDQHSSVAQTELRAGTGAYQSMGPGSSFPGEFRLNLDVPEGPLVLQARARDAFGNLGVSTQWTVTVDRTPPLIAISGVTDDGLYAGAVTPEVQVTDANLDTVALLLDGQNYASGTPVLPDGHHQLFVSASDRAGNRSQRHLQFVIDTTPPSLEFTFPAAGAVVSTATTTVLLATEPAAAITLSLGAHSVQADADANGVATFAAFPLAEGANVLQAFAVDAAGNASLPISRTLHRSSATLGLFSGQVLPSVASSEPGPDLTGSAVVTFLGSTAVSSIPTRLSLVQQASGLTVGQAQWTRDYAAGASVPQPYVFPSGALALGAYVLVLEAQLTDVGGQLVWVVLDQATLTLADLSPPGVDILQPQDGQLLPAAFGIAARVTDTYSAIGLVELLFDQQPPLAMSVSTAPIFETELDGIADGQHSFRVRAQDGSGHERTEPPLARLVEVDGTPPDIQVTGVVDGQLSNQPLAPGVTVTDAHPGSSEVLLDGVPYVAGTPIEADGSHQLVVNAVDAVGNAAQRAIAFTIDRTPPALEVQQPLDNSATPLSHVPVLASTEAGIEVEVLDQSSALIASSDSQGIARFPAVWLQPGDNTLRVRARDRAGNLSVIRSVRVLRLTSTAAPVEAVLEHAPAVPHGQLLAGMLTVTSTIANAPFGDELRLDVLAPSQALVARLDWSQSLLQGQSVELPFSFPTAAWPAGRLRLQLGWRRMTQPDAPFALIAASEVDVLDEVAPTLSLLAPNPGATVPHPIPVRVQASDGLSGIDEVSARVDEGAWVELAPAATPGEWQAELAAPAPGLRQLSFRAVDGAGNVRLLGPIAVCRDGAPEWSGFANGFEDPAASISGFEMQSCAQAAKALQRVFDWWRFDAGGRAGAERRRER